MNINKLKSSMKALAPVDDCNVLLSTGNGIELIWEWEYMGKRLCYCEYISQRKLESGCDSRVEYDIESLILLCEWPMWIRHRKAVVVHAVKSWFGLI